MNLGEMTHGVASTELLYLRQTQLATNQANVLKVFPEKRTHAYLVLDKTIFHPKGGGQPSDRGRMTSPDFVLEIKKAIHHQGVVIHWGKILSGTPSTGPRFLRIGLALQIFSYEATYRSAFTRSLSGKGYPNPC